MSNLICSTSDQSILTITDLAQQKNITSSIFFDAVRFIKQQKPGVVLGLAPKRGIRKMIGVIKRTARFELIGDRPPKDANFMVNVPIGGIIAIEIGPSAGPNTPIGSIVEQSLYQQGVAGIVIGGRLRDVESIPEERSIWALGTTCCGAYGELWEEEVDCPISILGTRVTLESLIVADESGIVVSPPLTPREVEIVGKFVDADNYAQFLVQHKGMNSNDAKDKASECFGLL
ncbi:MAG: hypothetical protein JGK17_11140 [Microcoleus sp. PH2017_10_PVI_O_A]|uniref:RraA family protein n=1 Tax=unclassified Microcoleus TaxID=2642155 RepID=UPI001D36574A|nr:MULTISPECIES: hypothetical protein [unclassified Microcoleus]TAE82907.1 MAG: hypothetical protein EAZ83_10870 [Oscillatoriales cyanobacterium]MCC3406126.1 hypothetical protein [Microcoleus sp. PH2017_10_PVI_O_A]MCC3460534.1 hypothetical protein [Microcoleus sp. PH2017_11_PCY_U_A]MCC3479027.1 hypothetical protein [Microcoleus sp. PH2017_12_PCY_D_A]MCC3529422.1 hypothetical protein [Microcoleus sp. PH2017_21_RUC_O_A]